MLKEFLKAMLVGLFLAFNFSVIATVSEENYFHTYTLCLLGVFGIGVPYHLYAYSKGNQSQNSYSYAGALTAGGYFFLYSIYRYLSDDFIYYELSSVLIFTLVGVFFVSALGFICAMTFWTFLVSKKKKYTGWVLFLWSLYIVPYFLTKVMV